jgi:hypothetical protein
VKRPRFVAVATAAIPDPRVNPAHRQPGDRQHSIVVTQYLDDSGAAWERWGTDPPVRLPGPVGKATDRASSTIRTRRRRSKPPGD